MALLRASALTVGANSARALRLPSHFERDPRATARRGPRSAMRFRAAGDRRIALGHRSCAWLNTPCSAHAPDHRPGTPSWKQDAAYPQIVTNGRSWVSLFHWLSSAITAGALPSALNDSTMLPQHGQPGRRAFGLGPTGTPRVPAQSRRADPVRNAVAHEPANRIVGVDGEIPFVPGESADVPTTGLKAIAEALTNRPGGDGAGRVAAPERAIEKSGKTVDECFHPVVDLHRVSRHQPTRADRATARTIDREAPGRVRSRDRARRAA